MFYDLRQGTYPFLEQEPFVETFIILKSART